MAGYLNWLEHGADNTTRWAAVSCALKKKKKAPDWILHVLCVFWYKTNDIIQLCLQLLYYYTFIVYYYTPHNGSYQKTR